MWLGVLRILRVMRGQSRDFCFVTGEDAQWVVPEVVAELEVEAGRSAVALVGLQVVVEAVAAADDRHQVLSVAVARIVDEVLAKAATEDALLVVVVAVVVVVVVVVAL